MTSELRRLASRIVNAVRPGRAEASLAREVASHRALLEEEYERRGLTPEAAALAATRALGGDARVKELHREARSLSWVDDLRRDLGYALRMCRRAPGFTAVVVVTLALGIGANTAIFSVVNAVLLQPLPYKDPARLVRLYENVPASESPNAKPRRLGGMNLIELLEVRARSRSLSGATSYGSAVVTMIGAGDAALVNGAAVSPGTFSMLGVAPVVGRGFTADEEKSAAHVLLVSSDAWRRHFDDDPKVVGRTVTFTGNSTFTGGIVFGTAYTIVGVMPRGFHYPYDTTEFWVPLALTRPTDGRPHRASMMAQLAEGASAGAAAAEVAAILSDVRGQPGLRADTSPPRFELVRVQDELSAPVKPALIVLTAAVGFVLLIACANVANLMMARAAARQAEIAVRVALGAGRARLVRQTFTESIVLGLVGGVAGTGLAAGGVLLFRRLGTTLARFDLGTATAFPRLGDITINQPVLAFAVAASVAAGVLFGLAPALGFVRDGRIDLLKEASSAHGGDLRRGRRAQSVLIVSEIAMATLLFVGGALLIRSFVNLAAVDPGFDPAHVLTFQVGVRGDRYPGSQQQAFADELVERLRGSPHVVAAGYARQLPMVNLQDSHTFRRTPALPPDGPQSGGDARYVSPGYLQAIGARLAAGRWPNGPREIAINATLRHRYFPDDSPLDKEAFIGAQPAPVYVAGVVDDQRLFGLDREAQAQFFLDLSQWTGPNQFPVGPYYAVRTDGAPEAIVASLTSLVRQLDDEAPLYNVATLEEIVSNSVTVQRLYAVLLGIFAIVAVGLAAVGIYGVMAYSVTQRTREIGIRMALGARRHEVVALVLRQGGVLTLAGLLLGIAGAAATTKYLEGLLFGVTPLDPSTFSIVAVAFASVATAAAYVPALRAARVDPAVALRRE